MIMYPNDRIMPDSVSATTGRGSHKTAPHTAAERLRDGEGVSGPAAARYLAAAQEFQTSYAGGFASKRQYKALLDNPRLQIFDHPQALLTLQPRSAKALCDPNRGKPGGQSQRTPSQDRCHRACANIAHRHPR
jgi:hypothetical protein